jgi:hypothetical protein
MPSLDSFTDTVFPDIASDARHGPSHDSGMLAHMLHPQSSSSAVKES